MTQRERSIEKAKIVLKGERMNHTPGPWTISTAENEDNGCVVVAANTRMICECYEDGEAQGDEDRANARLIAAAPELLDAAKNAQCACTLRERESGHLVGCWMPALTDAITKAERE